MKATTTFTARRLLISAVVALAPAGSALAIGDCAGDPFAPYHKSFRSEGPAYECTPAAFPEGAQGSPGPVIATERGEQVSPMRSTASAGGDDDPFAGYRAAFTGD